MRRVDIKLPTFWVEVPAGGLLIETQPFDADSEPPAIKEIIEVRLQRGCPSRRDGILASSGTERPEFSSLLPNLLKDCGFSLNALISSNSVNS